MQQGVPPIAELFNVRSGGWVSQVGPHVGATGPQCRVSHSAFRDRSGEYHSFSKRTRMAAIAPVHRGHPRRRLPASQPITGPVASVKMASVRSAPLRFA